MTDYDGTLRHIYQEFASFGATRGAAVPLMDGPKFAKFAKDCKLVDKSNLTATDVDLVFAKAKSKTERRITYDQFYTAVTMLADKRFPNQTGAGAFEALMKKIVTSQGPAATATVADSSGIYGKLTDSNLYTGSHKERFNADGSGKGLDGRDKVVKGTGSNRGVAPVNLQFHTDDEPSPPVSDDEETNEALAEQVAQLGESSDLSKSHPASPEKNSRDSVVTPPPRMNKTRPYLHTPHPKHSSPSTCISTPSPTAKDSPNYPLPHNYLTPTKSITAKKRSKYVSQSPIYLRFNTSVKFESPRVTKSPTRIKPSLPKSPTAVKSPAKSQTTSPMTKASSTPLSKSPSKPAPAKSSIFDKLTDSSQYTGSHKNRFNSDGSGRGMAGRDSVRKGGVSGQDLSQMVRRT